MTSSEEHGLRRRACSAVLDLARTVHTVRQHGDTPRLRNEALVRCTRELADLVAETDLVIELRGGEVRCLDQRVLDYGPTSVPFGLLAEAGIGEVVLSRGIPPADLEQLLVLLAGAGAPGGAARGDLAAEVHRAHLLGVHLRAPTADPLAARRSGQPVDWWLFPEPARDDAALRVVEREMAVNLPLAVARLLFADLDDGAHPGTNGGLLARLLTAMLADGDAAGASWLLGRAGHHPGVGATEACALRELARQTIASEWLEQQLEHEERLPALISLALELDGQCLHHLADAAADSGTPLPDWVASMLPPDDAS